MGDEQAEPATTGQHFEAPMAWADRSEQLRGDVVSMALYWYDLRQQPAASPAGRAAHEQQLAYADQRLTDAVAALRALRPPPTTSDLDTPGTNEELHP